MSEGNIVKARRNEHGKLVRVFDDGTTAELEDRTDWARLAAMTEEEIIANALSDPDNPPLTEDELARAIPVPNARRIREHLHLTQEEFATEFHVSLDTLRDWENGSVYPDSAARTLLRVIEKNPTAVREALKT